MSNIVELRLTKAEQRGFVKIGVRITRILKVNLGDSLTQLMLESLIGTSLSRRKQLLNLGVNCYTAMQLSNKNIH